MILCFWVLSFHCLEKNKINYFLFYITKTKFYHVPCFSLLSFYFSYNIFFYRSIIKLKKRLERLLIPYIIWPLFIFIINNIINHHNSISLYELKIQIILGRQFMVPLWYLFSMILLTIIFFILSNIFKKYFLFVLWLLSFFTYIIQYSGYYKFLNEYKNNVKLPILDTLSILPLSVLGLSIVSSNLKHILTDNKKTILFFSYLFLFFLFKYNIFIDLTGYNGIVNIFTSLLFFMCFSLLPLENINICVKRIIKTTTNYTNGIYCLQCKMIPLCRRLFGLKGNFKSCIIIYLISYFISFIGIMIFGKTRLKYLFI